MITIVFGKPGAGKTAYLTAQASQYLNGSAASQECLQSCIQELNVLNESGFNINLPDHAPVYTDYRLNVQTGYKQYTSAYYIDGFCLGFENPDIQVRYVYPCSKIFLTEAQRYYNSRKSKDLPDWVSRFYEEHRHFGLDIYMDVQRPALIDVNIRDIANKFIEVESCEVQYDQQTMSAKTTFKIKEFSDFKYVESYLSNDAKTFESREETVNFNVFEYFESKCYYRNFLPTGDEQFSSMEHVSLFDLEKDTELAKELYRQTPPAGFYPLKKGK